MRLDDISVEPGQKKVVWLSIGVNADRMAAMEAARTLLRVAEDNAATGITGAYAHSLEAHQKVLVKSLPPSLARLAAASLLCTPANGARRLAAPSRLAPQGALYSPEYGALTALAWVDDRPERTAAELNAWFSVLSNPDAPLSKTHALPTLDLFVLWQLHQSHNSIELLKRVYPFARHRYLERMAGCKIPGSALPGWPNIDPSRGDAGVVPGKPDTACAAFLASEAMLLSRLAILIGSQDTEKYRAEALELAAAIRKADVSQTAVLSSLTSLYPLLLGPYLLNPTEIETWGKTVKDETLFLSRYGLRSRSARANGYNPAERGAGGIDFKQNLLLISALLDCGKASDAAMISDRLLKGYAAASAAGTLPQWLNSESGSSNGLKDWSGDSCALIWLHRHFNTAGAAAAGTALEITGLKYDIAQDALDLYLSSFDETTAGSTPQAVLCMSKPHSAYAITGDVAQKATSDAQGRIFINGPTKPGKLHIMAAPVPSEPSK